MAAIQVGDPAPDVSSEAHDGTRFKLSDFRGQKAVVLFFYPSDGTPVCTAEVCAFRNSFTDFSDAGAVVIGVSGDSLVSHRRFASNHKLPFLLISDQDGTLRKSFGVPKTLVILPGRVTYVIDKHGIVRLIFNSQLNATQHISEALQVVKRLAAEAA